jgi:hypothetical protein
MRQRARRAEDPRLEQQELMKERTAVLGVSE